MAINFDTLKTSEDNLNKMFLDFYDHVIASQEYLFNVFKKTGRITPKDFQKISSNEKKSNEMEAKILDETCWIISKDMPRSSHLRYLIAIIRSIRDLERMGDFVERIGSILMKQNTLNKQMTSIICKIMLGSLGVSKKINHFLHTNSKNASSFYVNQATKSFFEFSKLYRACFKEIGQLIFKNNKDINNKIAIFTAIKNVERNADHAFNIIENFVYINQPNFYFTKESRKSK